MAGTTGAGRVRPMYKILADTCIWENLAKDPQQRPLLNVIFELETSGDLGLIVPRIVLEEFERRKEPSRRRTRKACPA